MNGCLLLQKRLENGETKELVYNAELLQSLLTLAGIKSHAGPLAESILQHISTQADKDVGQRLIELTKTQKNDGTIAVELKWCGLRSSLQEVNMKCWTALKFA